MTPPPAASFSLFDAGAGAAGARPTSFVKLDPRVQWRNPVMFVVYVGSILTTRARACRRSAATAKRRPASSSRVAVWLWFTVLFANFAEAIAEGPQQGAGGVAARHDARIIAQEAAERAEARRAVASAARPTSCARATSCWSRPATSIPLDGEVIEGVASVDESAITGESAPVIRESGGDFASVTGGTRVLSDWLVVRITVNPGEIVPRPHDRDGRRRASGRRRRTRSRSPSCWSR